MKQDRPIKKTIRSICFIHLGTPHDDLALIIEKLKEKGITSASLHLDDIDNYDFDTIDLICLRHCRGYHLMPDFIEKLNQLKAKVDLIQNKTISIINQMILAKDAADKNLYLRWLEREGVELIPTLWLAKHHKISLNEIIDKTQWTDFVFKPTISSKSWMTHRVSKLMSGKLEIRSENRMLTRLDADSILEKMLTTHDLCVQKFMPEILSSGEKSFVFIQGCFSHVISKTVSTNGWIAHELFGGRNQFVIADDKEVQWATAIYKKIAIRYGDLSYARIDGIYNSSKQLCLLECELLVPRLFLLEANKMDHYIDSIIKINDY